MLNTSLSYIHMRISISLESQQIVYKRFRNNQLKIENYRNLQKDLIN